MIFLSSDGPLVSGELCLFGRRENLLRDSLSHSLGGFVRYGGLTFSSLEWNQIQIENRDSAIGFSH